MVDQEQYSTIDEVAERLQVSDQTIRRWIKSGRLAAYKPGREWRIKTEDLERFLEARSSPKAPAPPSPEPSLFNGLEEERRTAEQFAAQWKYYVTMRVDWCEQVVERTAKTEWNNPFLSLDSAIQWALYIGIEAVHLRNIVNRKVIPRVDPPEAAQELQRLVQRFAALSDRTDERVNAMIEAAELDEEEKEQTKLRLIHDGKKSA
jgi:excisionase family DNA binding protein